MVASFMKTDLNKTLFQTRIEQIEAKGRILSKDDNTFSPCNSNNEPWMQFLQSKYECRLAHGSQAIDVGSKVPDKPLLKLPPGLESEAPTLQPQTSEYLRLLKEGASMAQVQQKPLRRKITSAEKSKHPNAHKNKVTSIHVESKTKLDLVDAIDRSISKNLAMQSGALGKKQDMPTQSNAPNTGCNNGMLRLLTNLIESSENKTQAEPQKTVEDDLFIERMNRAHDVSEEIYWSEDEKVEGILSKQVEFKKMSGSAHVFRKHFIPREYVMQDLDPILDGMVATLLYELNEIQNRHRSLGVGSDKRRSLFLGLREVLRAVRNRRIKCVIVAPDILEQDSEGNGNHEEMVQDILRLAYERDIPVVFALNRSRLGRSLGKLLRTSMVGILDAKGANDNLQAVIDLAYERRLSWLARKPKPPGSFVVEAKTEVSATPAQLPPWRKVTQVA